MTAYFVYRILIFVFTLASFSSVFFAVFTLVKKVNEGKLQFSNRTILRLYFKLGIFVSLLVSVFSLSLFLKSFFSYLINPDFSYEIYYSTGTGTASLTSAEINKLQRQDLIGGLFVFTVMFVILLIHKYGADILESKRDKEASFLSQIYNFANLGLYGVFSMITLPVGLFQMINYLVFDKSVLVTGTNQTPGVFISLAIVSMIIWIAYLYRILQKFKIRPS